MNQSVAAFHFTKPSKNFAWKSNGKVQYDWKFPEKWDNL